MRFIPSDDVHRICVWTKLCDALFKAHQGPEPKVDRSELHAERRGERETYFNLPAWQPGIAMGTKVVTVFPGNRELPSVQALYPLFDGRNGEPLAVLDGTALTYRKTAADSALGSRLLSKPDSRSLVMVGAGALSPYLIDAHRALRPTIDRVLIWNRDRAKAEKLAARLKAEVADDLETAVREADIVSCATAATSPVVKGAWLKPGAHLDLVGAFTPEMREADDEAVKRARLFVDSRWFAIDQPGDLADPLRRGIIRRQDIEADLFELCRDGYDVNRKPEDITLYKNGGGAHLDLFTALFVWQNLS
ncbi:Gfo/Idh/MocA family oxidoreductase [Taklimakanibacter deserti]|uniref:Gfo/Idh/MocA family oxidoreductase n=1 Tax=Taklimakanibacter deserti TaxID=2267839 RepID=UPI000E64F6FD